MGKRWGRRVEGGRREVEGRREGGREGGRVKGREGGRRRNDG